MVTAVPPPITASGGHVTVTGVARDSAGDIFVIGNINGTMSLSGNTLSSTPGTGGSGFVSKYFNNGTLVWTQLIGGRTGSTAYVDTTTALAVDASGTNVYVGVNYIGTLNVPGGTTIVSPTTNYFGAILSLNGTDGTRNNAPIRIGTTAGQHSVDSLALDSSGNLYAAGSMYDLVNAGTFPNQYATGGPTTFFGSTGSITITGDVSSGNSTPTYYGTGHYVLKADASGVLSWVSQIDAKASGQEPGNVSVAVNDAGSVYVGGSFYNVRFGKGAGAITQQAPGSTAGGFVAQLNSSGVFQWVDPLVANTSATVNGVASALPISVNGLAVDSSGNVIAVGSFSNGAKLVPGSSTAQTLPTRLANPYGSFSYVYGDRRAFVEKFSTTGASQFLATEGGTTGTTAGQRADSANHVVVDGSGNIVVTGTQSAGAGTSVFGTTTLTPNASVSNAFIWTLSNDATSTSTLFAGQFTSPQNASDGALASGTGAANVTVGLNTSGTVDFDPRSATTNNAAASSSGGLVVQAITDLGAPACFATGTRIRTERGDIAVEDLWVGDAVITHEGATRPVIWIGRRHVAVRRHAKPETVLPVRITAHAFGPSLPARDLVLSQDHALFCDGVLIPAHALINGTSIRIETVETVTYWHVELDQHDVLFAEGLPAESFREEGNRHDFEGGNVLSLHPYFTASGRPCAPLTVQGVKVEAVRTQVSKAFFSEEKKQKTFY